jgi:hypothetical protein
LKSLALPNHRYLSPMSGRHWRRGRVEKDDLVVARCGHQTCDFWFFANWLNSENLQRQSP